MTRMSFAWEAIPEDDGRAAAAWPREASKQLARMQARVAAVLLGKEETVRMAMTALLAGGHILLEDVPGVGKTVLAQALARVIGGTYNRIQFTPDLMPGDVTGSSIWDARRGDFVFREGPIMANLVLADELNRAAPRTQSALLEAMEERSLTVDGETRRLPEPFTLIATQNPAVEDGTYPLPAAQLDRFMVRLSVGYPVAEDEIRMLAEGSGHKRTETLRPFLLLEEWAAMQREAQQVHAHPALVAYMVEIVRMTRSAAGLRLGASPRATRDWLRAAQASAYIEGRGYLIPDDVKGTAASVLTHRLRLQPEAAHRGERAADILGGILSRVTLPIQAGSTGRGRA
ncbi:AAA family ATPase [Paenibacillus sp. 1P07SE]|uniref:AAA family ATPase n=1 Tax=Paenibacillus sp. 1P07SE TaxID=3132209 RepID=UPI0039A749DA